MMQNPAGGGALAKPQARNANVGFAPWGAAVAGNILANVIGIAALSSLGSLAFLVLEFVLIKPIVEDVNKMTGSSLAAWHILIPFYNWYWSIVTLRGEVTKAKERSGSKTPARGAAWYFFFPIVASSKDMNDIVEGR